MKFNLTPKAHILFCHTVGQSRALNGIGDKTEDFVEKAHQIGEKMEKMVARMPKQCYKQQQEITFKKLWMSTDPGAQKEQKEALQKTQRKKGNTDKQTKAQMDKAERDKRRRITKDTIVAKANLARNESQITSGIL